MREFNLEEAKAGAPVCTREGNKVKILCFDRELTDYPIVGYFITSRYTEISCWKNNGRLSEWQHQEDDGDLMMED